MNAQKIDPTEDQKPLIENENSYSMRFKIPPQPNFPIVQSILSILSLALLAGVSIYFYLKIEEQPLWVTLPFLFTIVGGALGFFFELGLLITGTPFQLMRSKVTTAIQMVRFLNIAPVVATIFFFVCSFTMEDVGLRITLLYIAAFLAFALAPALYFGGATATLPIIILSVQVAQIIMIIISGILRTPYHLVGEILLGQAVLQTIAFLVTTQTPIKSTGFHVLSSGSGWLLYLAVKEILKINPSFIQERVIHLTNSPLLLWGFIIACGAGFMFTMKASPVTYNVWRSRASNLIWSIQYFILISQKRFPIPKNLSDLYSGGAPKPSKLKPYYLQHPEYLPEALNIPAVERMEGNVTAFGKLVAKAKKAFKIITFLDQTFPQADVTVALKTKPRMSRWSDGSDIYPSLFTKTIFGLKLPITHFKITPPPAIDAYKEGQLLAYLAEFGIANTFLKKAPDREGYLMMDFRFLEKYETKPDYEPYGGIAFFKINKEKKKLELSSIIAPKTETELIVNPIDATYRRAESMVIASMYFMVISGKHLAGIHMTYNLLEVVLHNAFDAQGEFNHPLRTFMYLHLFSHELAEELTTEHLVQEGAVFTQIFATTHDGLINHLNDEYHNFCYGDDEDFEYRKEIMQLEKHEVLPGACINWELEYATIWQTYTDSLINIMYDHDEDVRKDKYVQEMYRGLKQVYFKPLPKRYDEFKTRKGVSRWASDTIHHLVVRHQVYGTTGINSAMDPRISSPQVPKDGGTPGVDEWRSLVSVGLATACSRFTLLLDPDDEKFTYLLKGVDPKYKDKMKVVFEKLHFDLVDLDKKWTSDAESREFNYNYFRAVPSVLRTGAGY